jgi:hypothetical protein
MKSFIVFVVLCFISIQASAVGQISGGEVAQIRVDKSGKGYVMFKTNLVGTPATCTQAMYAAVLAFDTNEPGGRAIYALVLAAKASGKRISAKGTGLCDTYEATIEDWNYGSMID